MNKSWRNVVIGDDNSREELKNKSESFYGNVSGPLAPSKSSNLNAKIPIAAENDTKRYERLLVVYSPLVGQRVTVFLYDGAIFEGTLDSLQTEKSKNEFALILRMATMNRPGREVIDPSIKAGVTFELMNIRFDDMAELKCNSTNKAGGIETDSAISKKKGDFGKERELHRWAPEEGSSGQLPALIASNTSSSSWDQFATNEKLFGLKTDFNEEMYTTKLDRNSAHIKANEAKAERIAKEIMMASSGGNVHLAEERGQGVNEGDEELLYGAVIRNESKSGTSSLPPGFNTAGSGSEPIKSTLNPSAPEFKLNADASEFNPSYTQSSKITYYNQPRHNLMNSGYYGSGYAGNHFGYPSGYSNYPVPYYYVQPPMAMPPVIPNNPPNTNINNIPPQDHNQSTPNPSTKSEMNPNATDFVMPQYYSSPQYYDGNGYSYGFNNNNNNSGYYHNQ